MSSSNQFFKLLIVRKTRACAQQLSTNVRYQATLEKGRRFTAVTSMHDAHALTYFTDAETGMMWMAPASAVFPLTGRFS